MSSADKTVETVAAPSTGWLPQRAAFAICIILLAVTAAGAWKLQQDRFLDKAPVLLHKELDRLDKAQLAPFRFVRSSSLSGEMVEALGTEKYIQWLIEDPRRQPNDPLRYPMLFITYYTGGRALVPHTPERCFIGANFNPMDKTPLHFTVPDVDQPGAQKDVAAKLLLFGKSGLVGLQQQVVAYTFYANCEFAAESDYLRLSLNKLGVPRAFFSKVEVIYSPMGELGGQNPDISQAGPAAQELLETVLPVLMRDHWPHPQELMTRESPTTR